MRGTMYASVAKSASGSPMSDRVRIFTSLSVSIVPLRFLLLRFFRHAFAKFTPALFLGANVRPLGLRNAIHRRMLDANFASEVCLERVIGPRTFVAEVRRRALLRLAASLARLRMVVGQRDPRSGNRAPSHIDFKLMPDAV